MVTRTGGNMTSYTIERRGQYWYLLEDNRVVYKSKDEQKVRSRYGGRLRSQANQVDREYASRTHYVDQMRNIFRGKL